MVTVVTDADRVLREAEQNEEEKKQLERENLAKKNHGFIQLSDDVSDTYAAMMLGKHANAAGLLMLISKRMDRHTNALVASQKALEELTGLSRTSLWRAIKHLQDHSWIQVVKIGTVNAYVVNSQVFWKSHGDKKHSVFHATVIATSTEQEQLDPSRSLLLRKFPVLLMKEKGKKEAEDAQPKASKATK